MDLPSSSGIRHQSVIRWIVQHGCSEAGSSNLLHLPALWTLWTPIMLYMRSLSIVKDIRSFTMISTSMCLQNHLSMQTNLCVFRVRDPIFGSQLLLYYFVRNWDHTDRGHRTAGHITKMELTFGRSFLPHSTPWVRAPVVQDCHSVVLMFLSLYLLQSVYHSLTILTVSHLLLGVHEGL